MIALFLVGVSGRGIAQTAVNDTVRACIGDRSSVFYVFGNDNPAGLTIRLNDFTQPSEGDLRGNTLGMFTYMPFGSTINKTFQYRFRDVNSSFVSNYATVFINNVVKNLTLSGTYSVSQNWVACNITSTAKMTAGTYNLNANSIEFLPGAELSEGTVVTVKNQ